MADEALRGRLARLAGVALEVAVDAGDPAGLILAQQSPTLLSGLGWRD
jgi:hypothetical protein